MVIGGRMYLVEERRKLILEEIISAGT
ncbi:DeoR/GlpR transcriptional regulator, partial [Salmonella enterica subsp. enterica serovar Infantis]|nr:DeoR/GlpR transcriptional regulator [Salmonella enterica subsp. enterica serovar Infantis]